MTVASPESVGFVEERAELETVLASPSFARAPRLAHLLSYLCERLFAGQAAQVKEYSIGVEVFQRGPEFDQDSDSIVRVEANRLRKRLAEYYAAEGASHPLRITIPIGQYVPIFQRFTAPEAVPAPILEMPPSPLPPSPPKPSPWRQWAARRAVYLPVAAVILVLAGFLAGRLRTHRPEVPATSAIAPPAPGAPLDTQVGLPVGEEIRILCGSTRSLVDHAGKLWSADTAFAGGTAVSSTAQHIERTQNQAFYRTSRQGNFRYDIPLKPGTYELHLHFAETELGSETAGGNGEGGRLMSVRANGKPLLSEFDVAVDAGASRTADVRVFANLSPAADGKLHLEFAGERGHSATVSAIEIVPGLHGRIRPVRVLARPTPYYSNDSQWWSPDAYFEGGQLASYAAPVTGTDDPELYEWERWGNFTYAVPVAPGRYNVILHFAARRGDWPAGSGEHAAHVFNVFCNGRALLEDFDLEKAAKKADVVIRQASGLEPNAQGKLLLSFVPVSGYATVTGIDVQAQ